jgi:hypothetical protein
MDKSKSLIFYCSGTVLPRIYRFLVIEGKLGILIDV